MKTRQLCIAAYGFLMLERLRGVKKNAARFKALALPEAFRPRGSGADAASRAWSITSTRFRLARAIARHRARIAAMPVLRGMSSGESQKK